jgi:hypothetical protein
VARQRLIAATFAGQAAVTVAAQFARWRTASEPEAVDRFCATVREHAASLPIVYFAEWIDRWLMGDQVPGPGKVAGRQFDASCLTPAQAIAWADECGSQFAEQEWLASRLREAAAGWGTVAEEYAVVVIREVIGPSTTDDEVRAALGSVPRWLALPEASERA